LSELRDWQASTATADDKVADLETGSGSAVMCSGLTYRFGAHTAVDHVDLRIESGETFGLLGPNGAGKTTTIRMLTTLLRPMQGSISVLGVNACPGSPGRRYPLPYRVRAAFPTGQPPGEPRQTPVSHSRQIHRTAPGPRIIPTSILPASLSSSARSAGDSTAIAPASTSARARHTCSAAVRPASVSTIAVDRRSAPSARST
jgi:energy-coupling factor transporter ATP-binding protein EcfA2